MIPINAKLHIYMRMNVWMKSRGWEDNRSTPFYNTFQHVNSTLGHQHTKAPLAAAALSPFMCPLYPPNPWCECMTWFVKVDNNTGVYIPYSFQKVVWVLLCPTRTLDKCKCCKMGSTVFCPYLRRLDSLTICRCHYKGSTFFSVI